MIERLSDAHDPTLAKVNVDEHPELALRYGLAGIPYVLLFDQGEVVSQTTGFAPIDVIRDALRLGDPNPAVGHV